MFEAVITYSSLNNLFYNINQAFKQAHRRAYMGYFSPYSFCLYAVIINLGSSSWKRSILVRISEKSSDEDEMRCVEMLRSLAGLHGLEFLKSRRGKASGWAVIRQAERNHIRYTIRTPPLLFLPNLPDHEKGNFHVAVSAVWSGKYCCLPCMLPFFQFKEKKILHSFKRSEFPSIHLTTWVSIQLTLWLIFQMKSSRDPHQPFPNLLYFLSYEEQCCWE